MTFCVKLTDNGYSVCQNVPTETALFRGNIYECIDYIREVLK